MNPDMPERDEIPAPVVSYEPTPQPVVTSQPAPIAAEVAESHVNSPGLIVLQWLTYAFWGWLIIALLFLTGLAATYSLQPAFSDITTEPVAYGIAAVFVLLPISLICDVFYSRRESAHKHGATMVIMVIHTVIFALLGIGALITIAFSVVSLLLGSGSTTGPLIAIIVAATAVILYVLTLLRTVRPFGFVTYRRVFRIVMLVAALAIATWGILGPVAQANRTKDDRMVKNAMQVVYEQINSYATDKKVLPPSLEAALDSDASYTYRGDISRSQVEDVIHRQLITYTRDATPASPSLDYLTNPSDKALYYTLCATYKYDSNPTSYGSSGSVANSDEYSAYYTSYERVHAGKNCYKLVQTVSGVSIGIDGTSHPSITTFKN